MADVVRDVDARLRVLFGPLRPLAVKPFSVSYRTADDQMMIKIYRGVEPTARQRREIEALRIAPTLGLAVPAVLDQGELAEAVWAAFQVVPGVPGNLSAGGTEFLAAVTDVMALLHRDCADGAGTGWVRAAKCDIAHSAHLAAQLSSRVQAMAWWPTLAERLWLLDDLPTVYLHGDLKPEHLLTSEAGTYVVDWEACSRGPAACDYADALFHLARDLIYTDRAADVCAPSTAPPPGFPVALAWRLVLWADRRRTEDLGRLPTDPIVELAHEARPDAALKLASHLIAHMRGLGTPR